MGLWTRCLLSDQGFVRKQIPTYPRLCLWYQTQLRNPGRTSSDFLKPLAQARAVGPGCAWPSGRPWAPACWQTPLGAEFGAGSAGNDLVWGQEALERTWVADRNFEVWPHQDRDWNTRPGRNLTLSWAAMSSLGEQTRKRSAGLLEVLLYRNIKNFFLWLLFMEFWHRHII